MQLFSRIAEQCASLVGKSNKKTPADQEFEGTVLSDPSRTHVDITSNDVHKQAIEYNKGMNSQAMLRNEISYYLQWSALGLFGAILGAGVTGQLGNLMAALTSVSGVAVMAGAVALAGAAIYMKVNNARIQSEKNMNLGEFEMRRSARIMAKELAQELKHGEPDYRAASPTEPTTEKWAALVTHSQSSPDSSVVR